jgi:hypothetical protein
MPYQLPCALAAAPMAIYKGAKTLAQVAPVAISEHPSTGVPRWSVVAAPSSLPPHAAQLAESVSRVVRSPPVGAIPSLSAACAVVLVI